MDDVVRMHIDGVDKLIENLRSMSAEVQKKHIANAVQKGARVVKEAVELEAEKNFSRGRVRGSFAANVRIRKLHPGIGGLRFGDDGRQVYMYSGKGGGSHWTFFEFGTKERVQKTTGRRTGRITPRPFVRPAYERSKRAAALAVADELASPFRKPRRGMRRV